MSAPCPFCGGGDTRRDHGRTLAGGMLSWVECRTCWARGPRRPTGDHAGAAWGARKETSRERALDRLSHYIERDLKAERAKLRRWQLRLRCRAESRLDPKRNIDRLWFRKAFKGALATEARQQLPIFGPRGVLP